MRHHVIISGTGRAGTTFLVQLFSALGLDTGFARDTSGGFASCNGGLELDLRAVDAPYIVKNPWLCDHLGSILAEGEIVIDHALIPVRDLYAAAESRRDVVRRSAPRTRVPDLVPGGLWHTRQPELQESVLTLQLYKLVLALAKFEVPTTLLFFPRLVTDAAYLYERLPPALRGDRQSFHRAFEAVSRPELVHDFRVDDGTDVRS